MRTFFKSFVVAALLSSAPVWAQAPAPPADAPAAITVEPAPPSPFQPSLDDPMLAPPPRPAQLVANWDDARQRLQAQSTQLREAEANLERAEGRWRQALSALLPNAQAAVGVGIDALNPSQPLLNVGGVSTFAGAPATSGVRPTAPLASASVSVTQSLVDLGVWRGLSSAQASTRSARAQLMDVRRRVTHGLAHTLVAVVAAERVAEINRISLRQALERAALTRRTLQLGAATQLDDLRVRQDVAVARSALIQGDENLRRTREALGLALGLDEQVSVAPKFGLEGLAQELREECRPLRDGELRSDLVAAREQVEAAASARAQAQAGYLPRLGLGSTVGAFTTTPGPGQLTNWSISAILSVPIWEGGFRGGLTTERAGAEAAATTAAEVQRRSVHFEVARARRAEGVAKSLVEAAAQARELAQKTDQLTRRSFEIGRATSLELVQSAVALRQAELALALREFEWVQARLEAFLTEASCEG